MNQCNNDIEILKIYSDEYKDKHHHFWNVYFRFIYANIALLGIYLLNANFGTQYIKSNRLLTLGIFLLLCLVLLLTSFSVLSLEHRALLQLGQKYTILLDQIGYQRLPDVINVKLLPFERLLWEKFNISSTMILSVVVLSILSMLLIIVRTFFFLPE